MIGSAFDLGEQMNNRTVRYILHKPLWNKFNYPSIDLNFSKWKSVKYLNDDCTDINSDVVQIPKNKGGLYLFYVKCPIITGITEYPLYIGRAQLTANQNLRKRVKEYFQHFARDAERPKITKMIKYWGDNLHIAYYPLDNNHDVVNLEKDIINSTLFELNDQIPDVEISEAIKAFNL